VAESSPGASTSGAPAADNPLATFGANEWLVDEMYERYKQDPNSVDKAWWDFFRNYHAEHGDESGANGATGKPAPAPERTAEQPATEKVPVAAAPPKGSPEKAKPEPEAAQTPRTPAAPKQPTKTTPATDVQPKADAKPASTTARLPKEPEKPAPTGTSDEPELTTLRGAPARTVQNMDISLSVPTATSVRSVPVKLLIDNRTVINNHLARARGGKVSFTHLIGFALVRALKQMPEMNNGFDVIDGKPTLIQPAHINLGLAIDMAKPDGTRQLLVPSIKAAESMDFAAFWTAYEDIVRKARNNKLAVSDFQGTTISLTNPGTIGTNHSVPRLMKGQATKSRSAC
jgi:2-oxoglutarate dehydrogenase E1 component